MVEVLACNIRARKFDINFNFFQCFPKFLRKILWCGYMQMLPALWSDLCSPDVHLKSTIIGVYLTFLN